LYFSELLLKQVGEDEKDLPKEFKLRYLVLLCKRKPDIVMQILNMYTFPPDDSLKICTKIRHLQGMAYLMTRIDQPEKAVKVYIQVGHVY
jgi:hypothetical protein